MIARNQSFIIMHINIDNIAIGRHEYVGASIFTHSNMKYYLLTFKKWTPLIEYTFYY